MKTPPSGLDLGFYFFYTYNGDCNSVAAQEEIKGKIGMLGICTGDCTIDKLESYCGETTVVNRRKRSTAKTLTMKVTIKVTTTKEKAIQDPTATQLTSKMTTVKADVLKKVQNINDWNKRVDSNIQSLDRTNTDPTPAKTCADIAETYNANAVNVQEQCGKFNYLIGYTLVFMVIE